MSYKGVTPSDVYSDNSAYTLQNKKVKSSLKGQKHEENSAVTLVDVLWTWELSVITKQKQNKELLHLLVWKNKE